MRFSDYLSLCYYSGAGLSRQRQEKLAYDAPPREGANSEIQKSNGAGKGI